MKLEGNYYFFNRRTGTLYKDIMLISSNSRIYIFDKDGKRCKGWTEYRGKKYYINKYGYAHTGWLKGKK